MSKKQRKKQTGRHGMPALSAEDDLFELFTGQKAATCLENSFAEQVAATLSDANMAAVIREKHAHAAADASLSLRERLKRYPGPEDEIDLHGCTADEAEQKVNAFVQRSRHHGMRTVRIITGKGLHSEGGAVLPDVVEARLRQLKESKLVLAFRWERKTKLKSGALVVYLS